MFKNTYFRLGMIATIFVLAVLVTLPKIPLKIKNKVIELDSSIGGYYLNLAGGKLVVDLQDFKKGLDIAGGVRVVLKADMSKISDTDKNSAIESATSVISRRVNLLGVTEPHIAPSKVGDEYRIVVEIPGLDDVSSAVNLIGQTAQLKFKQLAPDKTWDQSKFQEYYLDPTAWVDSDVTGADLKGADVVFPDQQDLRSANSPQIQLRFTSEGRDKFSELAKKNINKPIALFLDQESSPLSMPVVSPDLASGLTNDPVISGNFDIKTATALSVQLRAGALQESIQKSFIAGLVGLLVVLIFMVFMYGRLGLLADAALIMYTFVIAAIFKLVPVVLTLPGIAGFVLSIGMATDANILVFERIKEEILWGKPKSLAIKLGFERAWSSIKDSNISSLLTAGVLFYFGTGPVRGFALTLAIGILVSLFTSIFVVKTFIEVFKFGGGKNESN